MIHHPASISGQLQAEIQDVRSRIDRKAESYEVFTLAGRMDRLEHTVQNLCATLDGLRIELQAVRESVTSLFDATHGGR